MPIQRIRCIAMSEEEIEAASQILKNGPLFDRSGFNVSGFADEGAIRALEAKGLIVERIPDDAPIGWLEPDKAPRLPEAMTNRSSRPSILSALAKQGQERYIIQFAGPLLANERQLLGEIGVTLGAYVPDFAYKAALSHDQKIAVESQTFVRRVVHFDTALTLRRSQIGTRRTEVGQRESGADDTRELIYHVRCHNPADIPVVGAVLADDPRVHRLESGRNRIRLWTRSGDSRSLQADIADLPQVSVVEPYEYPAPFASFARQAIGVDVLDATPFPWQGDGQLIGVADSGIDTQHPDLKLRLQKLVERVIPQAPDDPFGHGTHVCSIIAGDGSASGGAIRGIAPASKLVVQGIRDEAGNYSGLPVDMAKLFQEAFDEGARVYNASWGFPGAGIYTTDALELDQFVFEHPDFLIVVAAGNEGQQPNPLDPSDPTGRIGYSSIASPATSKNSITVGGCCSPRSDGPYRGKSWKEYEGRLASPQLPLVSDEPISGNPDILAAFSSRGPTDDDRVKPDLVVPGTVILAAKSATSTPRFPETKFGGHYTYESGTSMAAPVVSGAAAISREYFVAEQDHPRPSAALLKATLVNGSDWISGPTVEDARVGRPNFHQGFGRLNMRRALPIPGNAEGLSLRFVDIYKEDPSALDSAKPQKSAWRKRIQVESGQELRITLCWTDHPAHGLQNHLDLLIQSPSGDRTVGNHELVRSVWAKVDRFNNTERIIVQEPETGIWLVMVNASAIPFPPQGFSLTATGKNLSDFF